MSFRLIEAERAQHAVSRLCQVLGVTRAGYYAWKGRAPSRRALADRELRALVGRIFADSRETYGAPRIQAELADEHDLRVSRKRIARLMRELRIAGVSRRRKGLRTTIRSREAPAAADLVRRDFRAAGPDRLWVADITYVPSWQGYVFLACVIDAWSRKVVGWSMRDDLRAELALDALAMALTRRRPRPTTPTAAASTRASPSARRSRPPASSRAWADEETPSTTPSPRASSPRSRPSCSTATASAAATRRGSRSSPTSRASTTPAAGTRRSATEARTASKRR